MNDDYLWDPAGADKVDPEIVRLEDSLGELRYRGEAPDPTAAPSPVEPVVAGRRWNLRGLLLAAALMVSFAAIASLVQEPRNEPGAATGGVAAADGPSWTVTALAGAPRVGDASVGASSSLAIGDWLVTDGTSRARLELPGLGEASGEVEVAEHSRVRLVVSREQEHRLQLAEGRIEALIFAPPRIFFVETASATAVDYGCAYSLEVDAEGTGTLEVTLGWVALENGDRSAFVPQGARCAIRPGSGPGTPHFLTATVAFQEAIDAFDFAGGGRAAVGAICREAGPRDTLTLWHLLPRLAAEERPQVVDRMLQLAELPAGATRVGILALDPEMLESWKEELDDSW